MSPATPAAPPTDSADQMIPDCGICGTRMTLQADAPTGPTTYSWQCLNMTCQQYKPAAPSTGPATPTPEGPQPQIDLALRQLLKQIVSVSAIPCGKHAEHELDGGIVYYCPWCEADQLVDEDHPFRFDRMLHLAQCPAQRLRHRLDDAPTLASGPAVRPQPQTRVQRDVVMSAIRIALKKDRTRVFPLGEDLINAITQEVVDALRFCGRQPPTGAEVNG